MNTSRPATLLPLALAALVLPLAGCFGPPHGEASGRRDVTDTTGAEQASPKILPVALIEFSDQAPRELVRDLNNIPRIRDTQGPVTIIMGDINNRTRIVSSDDFEVAARRLRNNLINSDFAQSKMTFVERRQRMERLADRESVASEGLLASPPDYDPQLTYALNGDFYRVARGDTNLYYMEFQLVSFATNEIVFSNRYDLKQVVGD